MRNMAVCGLFWRRLSLVTDFYCESWNKSHDKTSAHTPLVCRGSVRALASWIWMMLWPLWLYVDSQPWSPGLQLPLICCPTFPSDCSWWAPTLLLCWCRDDCWVSLLSRDTKRMTRANHQTLQRSWQCFNWTLLKAKTHISCQAWSCETLKCTPCWASNFSGSIINGQCYLFMCIFANYSASN